MGRLTAIGAFLFAGILASASTAAATEVYVPEQVLVSLAPGHTIGEVNERWETATIDSLAGANVYLLYCEGVEDCEAYAAYMVIEDPAIADAEANYYEETPEAIRQMIIVAVGGTMVDYEDQALTERIGLDAAHELSRGQGVRVAVLDTGIDPDHPVFVNRIDTLCWDFVDGDAEPWDSANGLDDDGDYVIDEGFGHGTMVAGIVSLVAPEATLLPLRVLDDEGRGTVFGIAKAIRYAVDQGADVVNMSFGVPRTVSMIGRQLDYADSAGVVLVAGAGNENRHQQYYPGAHSKTMMITALDSLDVKADFADWHSNVHVSAPGTGVRSAYPGGEWGLGAGCSFATPFVAGEAALIRSLSAWISKEAIEDRIVAAVDPIYGIPANDPYDGKLGAGRIALDEALVGLPAAASDGRGPASVVAHAVPNPAAGGIRFALPQAHGAATGAVYDLSGRLVKRIVPAGKASPRWDATDRAGRPVAAGVYYAIFRHGADRISIPVRIVR